MTQLFKFFRCLLLLLAITPLAAQTPLTWDPATTQAGTNVYTHPNGNAGEYAFSVTVPVGSVAGMRFRLNVTAGNADIYVRQGTQPTTSSYSYSSVLAGSDQVNIDPGSYSAGQTWYVLVKAFAGASWQLLAGNAALTVGWDTGATHAGTTVYSHPTTAAGEFWFRIPTQASVNGGWRTALNVTSGTAHVYLRQGYLPTTASYSNSSLNNAGGNGMVLKPNQFSAAQEWFILVRAVTTASWNLVTGDIHVADLGTLGFTDANGNGQYDIGEAIIPGGSGAVTMGPEGMRFFRSTVPAGTPAWSLWLNGDPRELCIRKTTAPFPDSASYYDRKQSGQMLVVAPYLGSGSSAYFLSVTGAAGSALNLDSRIQQVTDIAFNTTVPNISVNGPPYRVYRTTVPVDQIAWDVSTTALAGNPNICVRKVNPPAEFDNDAFSEAPGSAKDSVSLVPDFLTNGTWFITVYGNSPYDLTLKSGDPTVTPLAYTDAKTNDEPTRAGWRYYALTDIPAQIGTLGWELLLANQVPGSMIGIRRNKVPSRWQYRTGGSVYINDTAAQYMDFSGSLGFLQRPGHQADIWYVGVFTPQVPLGAFDLTVQPLTPPTVTLDGSSTAISNLLPGRWKFMRVTVPAGIQGWDVRLKNVLGGTANLVVRRDQLPSQTGNSPSSYPLSSPTWTSGYAIGGMIDWTGRTYDIGAPTYSQPGQGLVLGMGRPLEPGTYYVGVYNSHTTNNCTCTVESRGIGTGQTISITNLDFAAGSAASTGNLAGREAAYFKVTIPASTPSWEFGLTPSAGEMMLAARRGTIPDFSTYPYTWSGGGDVQADAAYTNDLEAEVQRTGPERYVILPREDQDYIVPGDYYIAAVSEGLAPATNVIGSGTSSGTLTSYGSLATPSLGTIDAIGSTVPVSLIGGQLKAYSFVVPAGTASLEVRLDNRVGNPRMAVIGGTRIPSPTGAYADFGVNNGEFTPPAGLTPRTTDDDLITVANPPVGNYTVVVRADTLAGVYADATANLVVVANSPIPLTFDGGVTTLGGVPATAWRYFQVTVPAGVVGWDIRLKNVTSGDARLVVRRDQLPASTSTAGWSYPQAESSWATGRAIGGGVDWTGRNYELYANPFPQVRNRLVLGMGRPLEPGTYFVGVYNNHATDAAGFTVESRGIGTGQTIPVTDLAMIGGSSTITNLPPREAAYFKVSVPVNTPSWEFTLTPTTGEMMLAARRGTVPDFFSYSYAYTAGGDVQATADFGDRQMEMQKTGQDRYVLLPAENQNALVPGDYYIAAISEGVNPPNSQTIGTGTSSGVLASQGALAITNLGTANALGIGAPVSLAGAQIKAYTFFIPVGTASLEVRLDNRVGNPRMSLISGTRIPIPGGQVYDIGYNNGQNAVPAGGVNRLTDDDLLTVANPPSGNYSLTVRADEIYPNYPAATADLVIIANAPLPLAFDGGSQNMSAQAASSWRYFEVTVPAGPQGWDLKISNITGGDPRMVVRRGSLPAALNTTPWSYPQSTDAWPIGNSVAASTDWTGRTYDIGYPTYQRAGARLVFGMGRPLEPGTYVVGVQNTHATQPAAYSMQSRGIGTAQTLPVTALSFAGGSSVISNLPRREAAYYKVTVPANTASWDISLTTTLGEMMMVVRRGTIPDVWAYTNSTGPGGDLQSTNTYGDREAKVQKAGNEHYLLLPAEDQNFLVPGDYFIAVISEGANPPDSQTIGTGDSGGTLTSHGLLVVPDLGTATEAGSSTPVVLAGAQVKGYQFTVAAGTQNLEVRLDNRVGNPMFHLISGNRLPQVGNYLGEFGSNNGEYYAAVGGVNRLMDDNVLTVSNPPPGVYSLTVRADYLSGTYPDATANLIVRQLPRQPLNFDSTLNGNGLSHTDTRQLIDGQRFYYEVPVPATNAKGEPTLGWHLRLNHAQGDTTLRIYNTWGSTSGVTISGNSALLVPPYLTLGGTWYVEVLATGLTNYTLTSTAVSLARNPYPMPLGHNTQFGDTGVDNVGTPLPGDRGTDIGQDDWHFYAVEVPAGNAGLLRTELQAINGNPNLYIREDGVPTPDHYTNGPSGASLVHRSLTAAASEYGNWVPLNGRYENQLRPGRWFLAVKATGGTNARYRLLLSTGQVTDLALNGGAASAQSMVGRDWRYYRFTVPLDAPLSWNLTFSQTLGDVLMYLRDSLPPGQAADGLESYDNGVGYNTGLRTWAGDGKNQGPYSNVGHDAAGTYIFTTPPLRPGSVYYVGFRATNDATFNFSAATSGGSVGILPVLDFYSGTVPSMSLPAGATQVWRIPAPLDGTRLKFSATNPVGIQFRLEQGTLPGTSGPQHWTSSAANISYNQILTQPNNWPWQPGRDYYLRVTNTTGAALSLALNMTSVNALTEDEDADGLPDAWELLYYVSIYSNNGTSDTDNDGSTNAQEFANGTNPIVAASAKYTATLNGIHGTVGKSPNIPLHDRSSMVDCNNAPDPGYTFLGWLRGDAVSDNTACHITGNVTIPAPGTYTFGTNADDGVRLSINGAAVITDDSTHGTTDRLGVVNFPAAGNYPIVLDWFDYTSTENLEFFAAAGTQVSFNATFRLVGDAANGGLVAGPFAMRHVASHANTIYNLANTDALLAGTLPAKAEITVLQNVINHTGSGSGEGRFPNGVPFPLSQLMTGAPASDTMLRNANYFALNTLPLATVLDTPTLTWLTSGDAPWLGENAAASFDTVDQAFSPPLQDNQQANLNTTVEGPGVLTWRWKVSSQTGGDYLQLYDNNSGTSSYISGDVPWTLVTYNVPAGMHTLTWRYYKNGSTASGADRGWVDAVNWLPTRYSLAVSANGGTVTQNPALAEYIPGTSVTLTAVPSPGNAFLSYTGDLSTTANPTNITLSANRNVTANFNTVGSAVDAHSQSWALSSTSGLLAQYWATQNVTTHDGIDAAQSGVISHSQFTQFETTVTGPNNLTFWWKVSSEAVNDPLRFLIDGTEQARISGLGGAWEQRTYSIPAGNHTLRWRYEKNASVSAGSDAAWVDQIIYGNNFLAWQAAHFAPAELADPLISGPAADADHDGIPNVIESAMGLDPRTPNPAGALPGPLLAPAGGVPGAPPVLQLEFLILSVLPADIIIRFQAADELGGWTTLATKNGNAPWAGPAFIVTTPEPPGRTRVIIQDLPPLGAARRFVRLEFTAP